MSSPFWGDEKNKRNKKKEETVVEYYFFFLFLVATGISNVIIRCRWRWIVVASLHSTTAAS
jgi:hypothetical protein